MQLLGHELLESGNAVAAEPHLTQVAGGLSTACCACVLPVPLCVLCLCGTRGLHRCWQAGWVAPAPAAVGRREL